MKLVPYTVMVPEHYAAFMEEMDKILPDFKYVEATLFVDNQVLSDTNRDFLNAIDWAISGWTFDTPEEEAEAEAKIRDACRRLVAAEAMAESEVEA